MTYSAFVVYQSSERWSFLNNIHVLFYTCQAIDAIDNGINQFDTDQPPKYVNNTHLSSRLGRFNLDWTDPDQSQEKENEAFQRAMSLAGSEFLDVSSLFLPFSFQSL